jgi:succinylarginine dihydrolase
MCSPDQVAVLQTMINDREKHAKHSQALHAVCEGIAVHVRNCGTFRQSGYQIVIESGEDLAKFCVKMRDLGGKV